MVSDGDDEEDEVTAAVQRALQAKERERKRLEKEEAKRQKKRSRAEEQAGKLCLRTYARHSSGIGAIPSGSSTERSWGSCSTE